MNGASMPISMHDKLIDESTTKINIERMMKIDNAGENIHKLADLYAPEVYDSEIKTEITKKNRFNISIMPKIALIVNPQLEFFVTAGIVIASDRYKISFPNARSKADDSIKQTVTKAVPRVGCGAVINLGQTGTYIRLGYYSTFKAKGTKKIDELNIKNTFETSDQTIRIGLGKRF
jgi:opacity protein-like surface antigen